MRSKLIQPTRKGNSNYIGLIETKQTHQEKGCYHTVVALDNKFSTASFVGRAGMAPLSVTVRAPQAFAKRRASRSRCSSCQKVTLLCEYDEPVM